ncbi:MAG: HDOD domain-containing protein [Bdellovibrionales bacterium]
MTTEKAKKILSEVSIPARPEVLIKVTEAFKKGEPDFQLIAQLISQDIGLSASILQVVNSPFFGMRTKISSVQQAIGLLGFKKIMMLVRTMSVRNVCKNASKLVEFWDAANEIAFICSELANKINSTESDEAFSLGLFHACGIPIMMEHFPDYAEFYTIALSEPKTLSELEKEHYGLDHAEISGLLCRQWFLSPDIIIAVENHHRPFSVLCKKFPQHPSKLTMIAILKAAIGIHYELTKMSRTDISVEKDWQADYIDVLAFLGISETDFELFQDALIDTMNS